MELQLQRQKAKGPELKRSNWTGIPTQMKLDFERRSGLSFDDVRVHYNSDQPARLGALAYTQGNQVYMGPGQERHLPHELGHVVQQKAGRVRPTRWVGGLPVNDQPALEREADYWGAFPSCLPAVDWSAAAPGSDAAQMLMAVQFFPWSDFFKSSFWSAADVLLNMIQSGLRLFGLEPSAGGNAETVMTAIGAVLQAVNFVGVYSRGDSMHSSARAFSYLSTAFAVLADIISALAGVILSSGDVNSAGELNDDTGPRFAIASGFLGLSAIISMFCTSNMKANDKCRAAMDLCAVVFDLVAQLIALNANGNAAAVVSWVFLLLEALLRMVRYLLTVGGCPGIAPSKAGHSDQAGPGGGESGSSPQGALPLEAV